MASTNAFLFDTEQLTSFIAGGESSKNGFRMSESSLFGQL